MSTHKKSLTEKQPTMNLSYAEKMQDVSMCFFVKVQINYTRKNDIVINL